MTVRKLHSWFTPIPFRCWGVSLSLLTALACGCDGSSPGQPNPPETQTQTAASPGTSKSPTEISQATESKNRIPAGFPIPEGVELHENVYPIEQSLADGIIVKAFELHIALEKAGPLMQRQPGDIVIAARSANQRDGFWRKIRRTQISDGFLVLHTMDARIVEVVKRGDFSFSSRSDVVSARADGSRTRTQALTFARSFSFTHDLASDSRTLVEENGARIAVERGELEYNPTVDIDFSIDNFRIELNRFFIGGDTNLSAVFDIDVDRDANIQRTLDIVPERLGSISLSLLGRTAEVRPSMLLTYNLSAVGEGTYRDGFSIDGYLGAGLDCTSGSCRAIGSLTNEPPALAEDIEVEADGDLRIAFEARLQAGGTIYLDQEVRYSSMPLDLTFESFASLAYPFCPSSSSLTSKSRANEGLSSAAEVRMGDETLFQREGIVESNSSCSVGAQDLADGCQSAEDCGGGQFTCFQGMCVQSGKLRVSLTWEGDENLNLLVRTPAAELISERRRAGFHGGEMTIASGGGVACTDCGSCEGEFSRACEQLSFSECTSTPGCLVGEGETCQRPPAGCRFFDRTGCDEVSDMCQWKAYAPTSGKQLENVIFRELNPTDQFKVWIVNASADSTMRTEDIEYTLVIEEPERSKVLLFDGKLAPTNPESTIFVYDRSLDSL